MAAIPTAAQAASVRAVNVALPTTAPVLDHKAFPHIFETILAHAPAASILRLRLTCHALRDWADARLAPDLAIRYDYSSRGIVASSSTGFRPRFPTPVLARHTQTVEWPSSATSLFSRILAHTRIVDLAETFPPNGLEPLPTFLSEVEVARIAVCKDGWSEMPRPPDLSGPIAAREYVLLGPVSEWATMPGLRIPQGVDRVVINSPLHSPTVILENIGRSPQLRECVFIFDARAGLDRSVPDFDLKQQHQALVYSVAGLLVAGSEELRVLLVNLSAVRPMTLGIASAEMAGRTLEETLTQRVKFHIMRELGDSGTRGDRLRFLSLEEYTATRTPKQLSLEIGDREFRRMNAADRAAL